MKQYRTIIVDDEQISIKSISKIISHSQLPIDIVETFLSSKDALQFIQENPVDLLITDINMPEYSGIDLLRRIYEIDSSVSVIIITGFGSLDYAREAMEYGVKHFLQKPFTPSELLDSITKSIQRVDEKRASVLLWRKELVMSKILGETLNETFPQPFTMMTYQESEFPSFHSLFDQYFRDKGVEYVYGILQGTVMYLIFKEENAKLEIPDSLLQKRGVVVLQQGIILEKAKETFCRAFPFYEKSFYFKNLKCFKKEDLEEEMQSLSIPSIISEALGLVSENNYQKLERLILDLFSMAVKQLTPISQLKKCSYELAKILIEDGKLDTTVNDFAQTVTQLDYYLDLKEWIMKILRQSKAQKEADLIGKSISDSINLIVENNYQVSDLSLKWISKNKLFLNPEYMGKAYQKEMGKRFTNHLLEVRMGKAADLLKQGMRVYEVAEKVGYENNPDYFGQQFKKYHGLSPSQFLKNLKK